MTMSKKEEIKLKRAIRKAEAEKRKKALEVQEVKVMQPKEEKESKEKKVTFDQWWMLMNKKRNLKPWLKEIVWADFKARGVSKMEKEKVFEDALKLYGIK